MVALTALPMADQKVFRLADRWDVQMAASTAGMKVCQLAEKTVDVTAGYSAAWRAAWMACSKAD